VKRNTITFSITVEQICRSFVGIPTSVWLLHYYWLSNMETALCGFTWQGSSALALKVAKVRNTLALNTMVCDKIKPTYEQTLADRT